MATSSITSSTGTTSGLDVNSIVSQLMTVERQPLDKLDRKEASYQAQLSAYGTLKGALSTLHDALAAAANPATFRSLKSSVTDSTIANATITGNAQVGTHALQVTQLAQAQRLESAAFAATSTVVGGGTLTIQFGTYANGAFAQNADTASATIAIGANATLSDVRDAINAAHAGVSASLVNDGTGWRLALSSTQTGAANALRIGVNDNDGTNGDANGLSQLAYDASTGGLSQLTQTAAAQDALATIDGIAVKKPSNTMTDVIEGASLTVAGTGSVTLTVARDTNAASSAIQSFVKAYNDVAKTLNDLSAYNANTKQAATLQGDTTLLNVQSRLRALLGSTLPASTLSSLSQVGVGFGDNGTLKIDTTKLAAVLADPTQDVSTLFAAAGTASNSNLAFVSATSDTTAGAYGVSVTRAAAQGVATGSTPAALTITQGVNDTLAFAIDGVGASLTLAAGTYTAASLAAALQAGINGALTQAGSGAHVQVAQTAGVLSVTSSSYGSTSSVALNGGNALASLFGTPSATAGVDVAGSIGGVVATGAGQRLTAAGVSVNVIGTATGDVGTVNFSRGFADQLSTLIDKLTASDGVIASRTNGIDNSIKAIGKQRDEFNQRLTDIEARYRAQYTALDAMLQSMQSTSNYLTSQLASIPKPGTSNA